jgi:MFS family permease
MSPLAPFRHRAFFWLWLGVVVASVGTWAQMVGAQWLFVHDPNAATIVTLVQTASTLPMMLLALPAGVLADAFDRRWLMFGVQIYFIVIAALLAGLTTAGLMPPALLLTFTFAVGAGQAMLSPTWQALITELVPRNEFAAATRLDMVSVNVSRAAGPALAGLVIAHWGVPPVFAMTAVCSCFLAVVLLAWRRPRVTHGEREPFMPALVAGGRYVRHEPVVRKILLRFATFMVPACAVWALLPLIASQQLGLNADGYGLLFAALGLGAVIAALCLGWVKQHLSSNGVLELAASLSRSPSGLSSWYPTRGSRSLCSSYAASAGRPPSPPSSPSCSCFCPVGYAPAPSRSTSWCSWAHRRSRPRSGDSSPNIWAFEWPSWQLRHWWESVRLRGWRLECPRTSTWTALPWPTGVRQLLP